MSEQKDLGAKLAKLNAIDITTMKRVDQERHRGQIAELQGKLAWIDKCESAAQELELGRERQERTIATKFYPRASLN